MDKITLNTYIKCLTWNPLKRWMDDAKPGPVLCLLLRVSSDCAQPITGQVTEVTCPVIGRTQPELTLNKRQKTGPDETGNSLLLSDSKFYKLCLALCPLCWLSFIYPTAYSTIHSSYSREYVCVLYIVKTGW